VKLISLKYGQHKRLVAFVILCNLAVVCHCHHYHHNVFINTAINPLDSKGSATPNNTKLVHWPLMGVHLVQPRALLVVPNVTAHPSTASVPMTVLLYYGPLLCSVNVAPKGLTFTWQQQREYNDDSNNN